MTRTGGPEKLDGRIIAIASVVVIGAIMSILDSTITAVAIVPAIVLAIRVRGPAPAAAAPEPPRAAQAA
jgi:hypothetical protein